MVGVRASTSLRSMLSSDPAPRMIMFLGEPVTRNERFIPVTNAAEASTSSTTRGKIISSVWKNPEMSNAGIRIWLSRP